MSKVSISDVSERIQKQLEGMEALASTPRAMRAEQFANMVEAMRSALQEVETIEEELRRQNEDLLAAHEALEMERQRFQDLFELAPDGFLVTDLHGTIEAANPAVARLLNTAPRALIGKPFTVFVQIEQRAGLRTEVTHLRPGQQLQDLEVCLLPRQASPRSSLITIVRGIDNPEAPYRLFWILRDISERRAAEEVLRATEERLRHSQRLESIGRLAGGIAHSFNNLLAAIGFHTDLLLDDLPAGSDSRRHAEEILSAGDRAAALARQLLAFGRKQVLQPQVLRINKVISVMESMMRHLIGEHILLQTDLCLADPPVYVDLGQVEQVILNLVVNARDAMPAGGHLLLSTGIRVLAEESWGGEALRPGTYVALSVRDTGTGMTPEVLSRVFEPFYTTKDRDKGTGLGLSTVHGIVHQSGGAVRVESEPGFGTAFTVLLPVSELTESDIPPRRPPAHAPVAAVSDRGSEVILVTEDEDNIREPMTEILQACGYEVLAARDAGEALALCERHAAPVQLLITDMIMPGMNGNQLANHLMRIVPGLRVLFMSGYPEGTVADDPVLQEGWTFLQKPFPPAVLLTTVRSILDDLAETEVAV